MLMAVLFAKTHSGKFDNIVREGFSLTIVYSPINLPAGASTGFDSILGVSFLKNVYAS